MTMTAARPTTSLPTLHPLTLPLVAAQFAIFGMTFAVLSVLWKDIITAVGISEATFGRVLAVMPVAGAPLMLVGGYLGDRFGPRLLPTLGTLLLLAFCSTLAGPASLVLLLLAVTCQGIGGGVYDVAINTASIDYERRAPRSVLNGLHASFNVGAVGAALLTGVLRSSGVSYRLILGGMAALYVLMLIAIWLIPPPEPARDQAAHPDWRGTLRMMRGNRVLLRIALVLCCGLIIEGTIGTWATLYLRQDIGLAAWIGGAGYALFNVTMATGRFGNQRLLNRVGPRRALLGAGIGIILADALTLATRNPVVVIVGVAALGITTAGVFPTGFIIVGRVAPGVVGLVSSVLLAFAYIIWAISSPIVGGVADAVSLRVALGILGILGLGITLAAWRLPAQQSHRDETPAA